MPEPLQVLAQMGPLAIAPRYLGHMLSVLQGREDPRLPHGPLLGGRTLTATTIVDGIAVVPVLGPILPRADLFGMFGAVSVADLRATMHAVLNAAGIEGVLLAIDSPGGDVAGVADLADELFAARGRKPMLAAADEGMFSAAYWLGSAVGPVTLPRTGSVGSIGVLAVHTDISGTLETLGMKVSVVRSGTKKAQFSPFQPLSAEARDAMQAEVDRVAGIFFQAVARQRALGLAAVRGLEGGTLEGEAAVTGGLADAVAPLEHAFAALKAQITGGSRRERMQTMDDGKMLPTVPALPTSPAAGELEAARTEGRADAKAQIYDLQKAHEEAKKRARAEAAAEERQRAAEITRWCRFAGKPDLDEHYIGSDMTLEQIRNDLLEQTVTASPDIESTRLAGGRQRPLMSVEEIYTRRREQIHQAARARGMRPY